jgi:predicted nucleic acid-binding protein
MKYVLDSSVALKWVLPEADSDKAELLRDDFRNGVHDLLSPDIFSVELPHALTRAERRGIIAIGDAEPFLADILMTAPKLHAYTPLIRRSVAVSSAERVGVYDCLYVSLAEREGCELVTADDRLIKNLQAKFPFIIPLSALP